MSSTSEIPHNSSSCEDNTDNDSSGAEEAAVGGCPKKKKLPWAIKNIITPGLVAALDRTGIYSRRATFVLTEAAKSLGHQTEDIAVNRMSIHRQRKQHRGKFVEEFKARFPGKIHLIVHWDGKLLENLTSKQHVDRLPVIVTGDGGFSQLLGVPRIASGTGEAQASAVKCVLEEWHLCERVGGLCFDTTASNTGKKAGACALLEQKLQHNVLYFPCRHHIMELITGAAFEKTAGTGGSSGPEIKLFKRFRDQWEFIDKESF